MGHGSTPRPRQQARKVRLPVGAGPRVGLSSQGIRNVPNGKAQNAFQERSERLGQEGHTPSTRTRRRTDIGQETRQRVPKRQSLRLRGSMGLTSLLTILSQSLSTLAPAPSQAAAMTHSLQKARCRTWSHREREVSGGASFKSAWHGASHGAACARELIAIITHRDAQLVD